MRRIFACLLFLFSCKNLSAAPLYADLVVDAQTGRVLHATNPYDRIHPASLTKKMTLFLLFEDLKNHKISLRARLHTSHKASTQRPSKLNLNIGETLSVEEAIFALAIKSANDVAHVVAENLAENYDAFIARMNRKAKELGMNATHFYTPHGFPTRKERDNYTTAHDMMILARALYDRFPQYVHYFKAKVFYFKGHPYRSHNHLLGRVHGLDGIKTGFVNASGYNISTSAVRTLEDGSKRRLFAIVIGGSCYKSRDRRAEKLINEGFQMIERGTPTSVPFKEKTSKNTVEEPKIREILSEIKEEKNVAPQKSPKFIAIKTVKKVKKPLNGAASFRKIATSCKSLSQKKKILKRTVLKRKSVKRNSRKVL